MLLFALACQTDPKESTTPEETATDTPGETSVETDSSAESGESDTGSGDTEETDTGGATGETDTADETGETASTAAPALILFIGDGMGREHISGAGYYLNGATGSLRMEGMTAQGALRTASLTGITDSAASATAMATGVKTYNGALGVDRDGAAVETILERARAAGMSVGVVTTDNLVGATPSAFVVHLDDRNENEAIVKAYEANFPDVALGGGMVDFGLLMADTASYQSVATRDELVAAVPDGRPLLGAFAADRFPYYADGYGEAPELWEMTQVAIAWLDADPDGFVLMVEGARIDHASHSNDGDRVFQEVAELDRAVGVALDWAAPRGNATLLVTADHECGGLHLTGSSSAGDLPPVEWRWGGHTNSDVAVFGEGELADTLDAQRLDNTWVHAVLAAVVDGAAVVAPTEVPVVDGWLEDLGAAVVTQTWKSSFGTGFNQLDGLRVTSDADGLRVGVDGVFEDDSNLVVVLVDLDYGEGAGYLADVDALSDFVAETDAALSSARLAISVSGVGFDLALLSAQAEESWLTFPGSDLAGLRGLTGDYGDRNNFAWLESIMNYDDGNVSLWDDAAVDAGATGATSGGLEGLVPWTEVFPAGIPAAGTDVAVVAILLNSDGTWLSNQALPPLASSAEPGAEVLTLEAVVTLSVDASGNPLGPAVVAP